jgi:hypothetical protein
LQQDFVYVEMMKSVLLAQAEKQEREMKEAQAKAKTGR